MSQESPSERPDAGVTGPRRGEGLGHRLAGQWAQLREEHRPLSPTDLVPRPATAGAVDDRADAVPRGVQLAAAWAWRFLVIAAAADVVGYVVSYLAVVVLPLVIALLISALSLPLVGFLARHRVPRPLAAILVVILGLAAVVALLTFAGQQVANGASDLADQVVKGLDEVRDWLQNGPLHATDSQINDYIGRAQDTLASYSRDGDLLGRVTEVGTAVGHVFAGLFIVLFATYFFLSDGARIWAWVVRLAPRAARPAVDSSGRVAWISLTQFVRATVIVAAVDAIGIMIVAAVLRVPFVLAIGVLVFLGAFVPLIGATVAGSVAVLVALVDQGPITALIMLGGVVLVQQAEAHILQPFLMGRWVSVHPLGVIVAIATGVLVAGVAGALVAVPLAAAVNAVVTHLASYSSPGADPIEELADDFADLGADPPPEDLDHTVASTQDGAVGDTDALDESGGSDR